jgi:hypothetical protein
LQSFAYAIPEAQLFIAHDNNLLLPWELIFTFTTWTWSLVTSWTTQLPMNETVPTQQLSPVRSWIYYFARKMER